MAVGEKEGIQGEVNHADTVATFIVMLGLGASRAKWSSRTGGCVRPDPHFALSPFSSFFSFFLQGTYIFTFLLSSRVFIPPHDLLARVRQIYLKQRQQLEAASEKVKVCLPYAACLCVPG